MSCLLKLDDLSVAVIACDNEKTIGATLKSVAGLAGRLIVVDSGSTDRTQEIAAEYGAQVIEHAWEGHIGQKQFALEQCDTAWVLSLDSDESVLPDLASQIRSTVAGNDPKVHGAAVMRRVWYAGRELRHIWQPEWRTRLVRPQHAHWTGYDPHDRLDVEGNVVRLGGILRHDAFADVRELMRKQVAHGLRAAQSYQRLGKRGSALHLLVSPVAAFSKQMVLKSAWLDGWPGWVGATGAAISAAVKHARLLELINTTDGDGDGGGENP